MVEVEYIKLQDAINVIREQGIYGSGFSDEERENDVINMLESLPRTVLKEKNKE